MKRWIQGTGHYRQKWTDRYREVDIMTQVDRRIQTGGHIKRGQIDRERQTDEQMWTYSASLVNSRSTGRPLSVFWGVAGSGRRTAGWPKK